MSAARTVALLLGCGCVSVYQPGALRAGFPDAEHVTLAGVEVAVRPYVSRETGPSAVMLEFRLGNIGQQKAKIDFTAVEVEIDGHLSTPFDPEHELGPVWLAASDGAMERVIYQSAVSTDPSEVCVRLHQFVGAARDDDPHCFHLEGRWPSPR